MSRWMYNVDAAQPHVSQSTRLETGKLRGWLARRRWVASCTVLYCTVLYCTVLQVGGQLRRRQGGAQDSQDQPGTVCSNWDIDVKQCYTIIC